MAVILRIINAAEILKESWLKLSEKLRFTEDPRASRRLLLPSLVLSYFTTAPPTLLAGLLLIDIGLSFDRSVGVTGQIQTAASLIGAITAVLMGVWSVRFNHKSLLLLGLFFYCIFALGCSLALNFIMMLIAFSISGFGWATVEPMTYSLVGAHYSLEQRTRAIGWLLTGGALAYVIGAPVIGFIAGIGGWRWAFFGFMLPIPLLSLVLVAKGVPSPGRSPQPSGSPGQYREGFKAVFMNRSATACLVCSALTMAAWQAPVLYGLSFLRKRFLVSLGFATIVILVTALCYILGNLISDRVVNQLGRQPATVLTAVIVGIFTSLYTNMFHLWLALAMVFLSGMFFGMMFTASRSLTLEQVPSFPGTMMSLNSAAANMGAALGASVGGVALLLVDYEGVGLALGAMSLIAALIYYLVVRDPTSNVSESSKS